MKSILIGIVFSIMLLTGCSGDAATCYSNVQKAYPNAKIVSIPTSRFRFIVIPDSGNVRYVETRNASDDEISLDMEIK